MSNYTTMGENEPYEWNIVPLSVYVYGVDDPRNRPLFGSPEIKRALEEHYRETTLAADCPGPPCTTSSGAEWREMIGAGLSRTIYIFVVRTTVEQDRALIDEFNSLPNKNRFNPVTRNCANFTKDVVDRYFPGAAHRDVINDFGMASPKAIARTFTQYALKHPELHFRILHFAQVPGTIKRSSECRDGTEQLYHSKKLLIPMALFATHELPVFTAAYLLTGRFNPEHQWEKHPAPDAMDGPQSLDPNETPRAQLVGSSQDWERYRRAFQEIVESAIRDGEIPSRAYLRRFPKDLSANGFPMIAANGELWMRVSTSGGTFLLGLSARNVAASGSNPRLARLLILCRIDQELRSPKHSRENLAELAEDWSRLQSVSPVRSVSAANALSAIMIAGAN